MIATLKKEIRREVLRKRDSLSLGERIELSSLIGKNLQGLEEFKQSRVIHFFLTTKSEVITEGAIRKALSMGKKVVVPVVDSRHKRLSLSMIKDYDRELTPASHGIREPRPEFLRPISLHDIDLMVLPGVAFDIKGHRLGYGAGYYDRLLEDEEKRPYLVALAFEIQIIDNIPARNHDIRVDKIVTERRVIEAAVSSDR